MTTYDVKPSIPKVEILERQIISNPAKWEYRLRGETIRGDEIEVIVKLSPPKPGYHRCVGVSEAGDV